MADLKQRVDVRGTRTSEKRADVRGVARGGDVAASITASGSYGMAYGNGPVVNCLFAYPVFVGTKWLDNEIYVALAAQLQLYFRDLFKGNYGTVLNQYGFHYGAFVAAHFEGAPAKSTLADADAAQIVADLHTQGVIPDDTANQGNSITAHAAFLFLDDTVKLSDKLLGGSFCAPDLIYGYHWFNSNLRPVPFYYGVIACMTDSCVQGDPGMTALTQLQRLTVVASHEFAELVSDPHPWTGWNSPFGEIGDLCEGNNATITATESDGSVNSWTVQKEYSLYDDIHGGGSCASTSAAPSWSPAAKAAAAAASTRLVGGDHPNAAFARALLPLPATYRTQRKITRKPNEIHAFARRIMTDLPHTQIHAHLPDLLREAADVIERAERMSAKA